MSGMVKKGDRIFHALCGEGIVVDDLLRFNILGFVKVKFKKAPPIRYNMGENPCFMLVKDLRIEREAING